MLKNQIEGRECIGDNNETGTAYLQYKLLLLFVCLCAIAHVFHCPLSAVHRLRTILMVPLCTKEMDESCRIEWANMYALLVRTMTFSIGHPAMVEHVRQDCRVKIIIKYLRRFQHRQSRWKHVHTGCSTWAIVRVSRFNRISAKR